MVLEDSSPRPIQLKCQTCQRCRRTSTPTSCSALHLHVHPHCTALDFRPAMPEALGARDSDLIDYNHPPYRCTVWKLAHEGTCGTGISKCVFASFRQIMRYDISQLHRTLQQAHLMQQHLLVYPIHAAGPFPIRDTCEYSVFATLRVLARFHSRLTRLSCSELFSYCQMIDYCFLDPWCS